MTDSAAPPLERKSLLYRSGLGFDCINHVAGCSHGCRYPCHAFLLAKRYGRVNSYEEWCRPRVVSNALSLLERELLRKRKLPERVHLCLSTDPFMVGHPDVQELTLKLVELLNRAGVPVAILTKGLLPICLADSTRFNRENIYGISLVSLSEDFRRRFEPGASSYADRIVALKRLAEDGCRTRIHLEPYPTPNLIEQRLDEILEAVSFTDSLFLGRWNYQARVNDYPEVAEYYRRAQAAARRYCLLHRIECEF